MKTIALISGGLDSALAVKLIKNEGIEVIGLRFKTLFFGSKRKSPPDLRIEIKEINISDEFLELVRSPRYGYGSNMNPCIDCKIFMLRKAGEFMQEVGAKFIVTGEVLGQRPMSQNRRALELIEKRSGLEGFLLRPLCAKLLSETVPEREGWVRGENLLGLSGRSRAPQVELAKVLGFKEYTQPAGGCLLTDPQYAKKIKDLLGHKELNLDNVELLRIGRHFRLSPDTKLIVGRNEKENEKLVNLVKEEDYLFMPAIIAGPTALGRGGFNSELIKLSCGITCRYCDLNGNKNSDIIYKKIPEENNTLNVLPIIQEQLISLRI